MKHYELEAACRKKIADTTKQQLTPKKKLKIIKLAANINNSSNIDKIPEIYQKLIIVLLILK